MNEYVTPGITAAAVVVTYLIGRKQVHAQTVVASRQKWMDAIRTDIAKLMAEVTAYMFIPKSDKDEATATYKRMSFYCARIELRTNPEKPDHQRLIELIKAATNKVIDNWQAWEVTARPPMTDELNAIVAQSQKIFRGVWRHRIRKGK